TAGAARNSDLTAARWSAPLARRGAARRQTALAPWRSALRCPTSLRAGFALRTGLALLLRPGFALGTGLARRRAAALRRLALRAGLDHRQRHAPPFVVHRQHPHRHHVADRHNIVRAFDVAVGHPADVYQAAVLQADIDEGAEI